MLIWNGPSRVRAAGALAAALAVGGCHPPHIRHDGARGSLDRPMSVAAALTCPQSLGELTRTAQAADGQSCAYAGPGGEQVDLRRLDLAGRAPQDALAPTEASLQALEPPRPGASAFSVDAGGAGDEKHASINLPGVHIDAHGDSAEVKAFGVTVDADGDNANVNLGGGASRTVIRADPNGAEIRSSDVGPLNARFAYILAAERAGPSPFRAVGYLARGPTDGPLVVAVFRSPGSRQDWRGDHDLNALLALNVRA